MDSTTAPTAFLSEIFGSAEAGRGAISLAVVKGGKRARKAVAAAGSPQPVSALSIFLDSVVAGAAFEKLPDGLPLWGVSESSEADVSAESTLISDDEL